MQYALAGARRLQESSLSCARRMHINSLPRTQIFEPLADADVGIAEALQPHRNEGTHISLYHGCNQAL